MPGFFIFTEITPEQKDFNQLVEAICCYIKNSQVPKETSLDSLLKKTCEITNIEQKKQLIEAMDEAIIRAQSRFKNADEITWSQIEFNAFESTMLTLAEGYLTYQSSGCYAKTAATLFGAGFKYAASIYSAQYISNQYYKTTNEHNIEVRASLFREALQKQENNNSMVNNI